MAIYVDSLCHYGSVFGKSCHMIADSVSELVEFAEKIGMKRVWLQHTSMPHFDLTKKYRDLAVQNGAIQLSRGRFVRKLAELSCTRRLKKVEVRSSSHVI